MMIEKYFGRFPRVLDLGTGTGILGIAAVKLGAKEVVAVDSDPVALNEARRNMSLNGVRMQLILSDAGGLLRDARSLRVSPPVKTGSFHLVVANLTSRSHECLAPLYRKLLRDGGIIIAGGVPFRKSQEGLSGQEVAAVFRKEGLSVVEQARMGEWVALAAQRKKKIRT